MIVDNNPELTVWDNIVSAFVVGLYFAGLAFVVWGWTGFPHFWRILG